MRVFLIGYMGSGKTTYGKKIANKLGFEFFDLDTYIETKYKATISQLFNQYSEKGFREIESKSLFEFFKKDDFVLSTGGGTPCFFDNMYQMNKFGITVYLKTPLNIIIGRLKSSKRQRPLLQNKSPEELTLFLKETLMKREPFYDQAKVIFDASKFQLYELVRILKHNF